MSAIIIAPFTIAYIDCALWASTDAEDEPLDDYGISDIARETLKQMATDCEDFATANASLLSQAYETGYSITQAGRDFWLTRNWHGSGFWDRGLGDIGRKLTDAAHVYGSASLYIGDDGMIYGTSERTNEHET